MESKNTSQIQGIKRIGGSNLIEITFPTGRAYFSYSEPVVINIWGRCFRTEENFSHTTSMHIRNLTEQWGNKCHTLPHKYICCLVDHLCGRQSWAFHRSLKDTIWELIKNGEKPEQVGT